MVFLLPFVRRWGKNSFFLSFDVGPICYVVYIPCNDDKGQDRVEVECTVKLIKPDLA